MILTLDNQTYWFCDGIWTDVENYDPETEMFYQADCREWVQTLDESHPEWQRSN